MLPRIKVVVDSVTCRTQGEKLSLRAVQDDNVPDNQKISTQSIQGQLEFFISNPLLLNTIKPGKQYYLDLIEIPDPSP